MKGLSLIAFLLFIVSGLKAQESYLGRSRKEVVSILSTNKTLQLQDSSHTDNGLLIFYHYKISEISDLFVYFDQENICSMAVYTASSKEIISMTVQDLNKKFQNIGSYEWMDKNASVGVKLRIGEEGFSLIYKKL